MSKRIKRASGGRTFYTGAGSKVAKEAVEKKDGGCVKKARGGGVGADKSPFSSAGGGGASKHPFSSAHRG